MVAGSAVVYETPTTNCFSRCLSVKGHKLCVEICGIICMYMLYVLTLLIAHVHIITSHACDVVILSCTSNNYRLYALTPACTCNNITCTNINTCFDVYLCLCAGSGVARAAGPVPAGGTAAAAAG